MDAGSKDSLMTSNENASMFTYEFPEVDSDLSIFSVLEEEALAAEHFLDHDKRFGDSVLNFNAFHPQKCFNIENFSFAVEYDQIKIETGLHFDLTQEGEENKQEVLDAKLQGSDDMDLCGLDCPATGETLFDMNSTGEVSNLKCGSCKDSCLGNVGSENHSQGSLLRVCGAMQCDITSNQNEGRTKFLSCTESSSRAGGTIQLDHENRSGVKPLTRKRLSSCDSLKTSSSEVSEVGISSSDGNNRAVSLVTEKRLRKPPRRYSEVSLDFKFRSNHRKCKMSYKITKEKSHKRHLEKGFGEAAIVCQDESFDGGCIQVPFGQPIEEGFSLKEKSSRDWKVRQNNALIVPKQEIVAAPYSAESEDDNTEDEGVTKSNSGKVSGRRKHHISWTLSEVMKLIEGVSQYGVGRWTEIKRLQFSSSSHRTSVDLKDKWRNLLRSSDAQLRNRRRVEIGRKQTSHQVPETVLCRVRELATIYPYPRESRNKLSCTAPAASSFPTTTSNALVPLSTVV